MFYSLQTELLAQMKMEEMEQELERRALHRLLDEPKPGHKERLQRAVYDTGELVSRTGAWMQRVAEPRPTAAKQTPAQECC